MFKKYFAAVGIGVLTLFLALPGIGAPQADPKAPESLAAKIDALLSPVYKAGEPGAAVLVEKDGRPLVRKAYGTADLELGVKLEPDMVFRIGSMTKQFTAVAVLMLMEQGKVGLNDPITKFLPDYPTQGRTITVENLLTHTSGIKDYTSLPEWLPLVRKDMSLTELIAVFKDKPMDFDPGERWRYSNSGYVLLGAIIEKAAGMSYEAFLQKAIFEPLGLKNSYYGSASRVIPRRIPGYGPGPNDTFLNAEYLSMTQPYAAGSLLTNVDDLAVWNDALLSGRLIKRESLERAWTPFKLKDGTSTGYGYGWTIGEYAGHRMIRHGGGIHGFTSDGILFPEDKLFVTVLTNSMIAARTPDKFSLRIAALALGKPIVEPKAVNIPEKDLAPLAGVYVNAWKEEFLVRVDGARVEISGAEIGRTVVVPLSPDIFFLEGSSARVEFKRDTKGKPLEVVFSAGYGPVMRFARTDKPLPVEQKPVSIDSRIFDQYAGEYEMAPGFIIKVFRDGARFMIQAPGQPALEIFAETETKFFLKVVDAQAEFIKDAAGKVTEMVFTQAGQQMKAKRRTS